MNRHINRIMGQTSNSQPPPPGAIDQAMILCDEEYQKFDTDPSVADHGFYTLIRNKEKLRRNLTDILANLYWRCREQVAFLELFAIISESGLFTAEALAAPVNYRYTSDNVRNVMSMLCCFPKIVELEEPPALRGEDRIQLSPFTAPIHWLAVMICRCCGKLSDVNHVIGLIGHFRLFGKLDINAVDAFNKERADYAERQTKKKAKVGPIFERNENENVAAKTEHYTFALMLPSGKGSDIRQIFHDAVERFDAVFATYFHLTTEDLGLEDFGVEDL